MLTKDGHSVKLKKVPDLNAVKLWVNGELVFSCDITDLNFGKFLELPLCWHNYWIGLNEFYAEPHKAFYCTNLLDSYSFLFGIKQFSTDLLGDKDVQTLKILFWKLTTV